MRTRSSHGLPALCLAAALTLPAATPAAAQTTRSGPVKPTIKTGAEPTQKSGTPRPTAPVAKTAAELADAASAPLQVPTGFVAAIVADKLGKARHLVVNKHGDVFVRLAKPVNGYGTVRLRDTDGNGSLDQQMGFGEFGGTGIALHEGYLYTSSNTDVYRYKLDAQEQVLTPNQPQRIVTGLIDRGTHNTKSLALDGAGNLYVIVGAPSNNCQEKDRTLGSPGMSPCGLLDSVGGIWQFKESIKKCGAGRLYYL